MSTLLHYLLLISTSILPFIQDNISKENHPKIHSGLKQGNTIFVNPIKKNDFKYISSKYGWRINPWTAKWQFHHGIDIVSHNEDALIHSTQSGRVSKVNRDVNQALGLWIEIEHPNGYKSRYGHLSKIYVDQGASVILGQAIGRIGNTGKVTGKHLHYEITYRDKSINPLMIP